MKNIVLFILMMAPGLVPAQDKRPNIIVIMADDMGFSDIGCFGGEIPTPNLDRLAANGLRLNSFYNTGRCCPTRASLLTGVYPQEAGVGFMVDPKPPMSKNPSYQGFLNRETVTFGEAMKEAGYYTLLSGKWHVGGAEGQLPSDRGFMRSLAAPAGGFMYSGHERAKVLLDGKPVRPGIDVPEDWYATDLWTDYGLKFIDEARQTPKPFLLYLAHTAPHFPLQAPQAEIDRFRGKYRQDWEKLRKERFRRQQEMNLLTGKYDLTPSNPKIPKWETLSGEEQDRYDHMMAIYAAMVSHLDKSIGRLLDGLEERGLLENTLILFFSDNGGNAESGVKGITRGDTLGNRNSTVFLGQCWAELNNTPFWLYKHHTSEGGIASPFIAHWPKGIKPSMNGKILNTPTHVVDILPTLLDLAKGKYPTSYGGNRIKKPRGVSLAPLFSGRSLTRTQPLYWEHEGNRAIRNGQWKAVSNLGEPWQLYNMEENRTELNDLSLKRPEKLNELVSMYEKWYREAGAHPYFETVMPWQSSIAEVLKNN